MKIAVTCDNQQVFQHFGHTPEFAVFDVADGKITAFKIEPTGDSGHGALAGFLTDRQVDVLLCGGIGGGAINALASAGIKVVGGVSGSVFKAAEAFLNGTLEADADYLCSHHHSDSEAGCGEHGCGHHGETESGHCGGGHCQH